ncbi:hypothetical protein NDU88_003867 [Pleurodeles waltl]|uniref:Uncharacterized protein n=1 Tax=Pleurodeles waltl TaxID=8319 RepID=A0AAV7VFG7_PLEWA|nr:hypothetical protein NDU88_003867 [Pleurodeles waltl]
MNTAASSHGVVRKKSSCFIAALRFHYHRSGARWDPYQYDEQAMAKEKRRPRHGVNYVIMHDVRWAF